MKRLADMRTTDDLIVRVDKEKVMVMTCMMDGDWSPYWIVQVYSGPQKGEAFTIREYQLEVFLDLMEPEIEAAQP